MTQRRAPSGQGPARRPGTGSRTRQTNPVSRTRQNTGKGQTVSRTRQRPALSRRTVNVNRGETKRTTAPRPRALTGRATVLIIVFVALALAYTYPLRVYLAQKSQIAQLKADQTAQQKAIDAKTIDLQKWKDPEYLRAQARQQLFYVDPGDTPLTVIPPDPADKSAKPTAPAPDRWYETLWSSVEAADAEQPK